MPSDSLDDGAIGSAHGAAAGRRRHGVEAEVEEKRGWGLGLRFYILRRRGICEVVNPSPRVEHDGPKIWASRPMFFRLVVGLWLTLRAWCSPFSFSDMIFLSRTRIWYTMICKTHQEVSIFNPFLTRHESFATCSCRCNGKLYSQQSASIYGSHAGCFRKAKIPFQQFV
jgi:hypothetical protein